MKVYNHNPKSFGDRIRHFRERQKITQDELARRIGLQASWISHFETGNRSPGIENLIRLAQGLDVAMDDLCGVYTRAKMIDKLKGQA